MSKGDLLQDVCGGSEGVLHVEIPDREKAFDRDNRDGLWNYVAAYAVGGELPWSLYTFEECRSLVCNGDNSGLRG